MREKSARMDRERDLFEQEEIEIEIEFLFFDFVGIPNDRTARRSSDAPHLVIDRQIPFGSVFHFAPMRFVVLFEEAVVVKREWGVGLDACFIRLELQVNRLKMIVALLRNRVAEIIFDANVEETETVSLMSVDIGFAFQTEIFDFLIVVRQLKNPSEAQRTIVIHQPFQVRFHAKGSVFQNVLQLHLIERR